MVFLPDLHFCCLQNMVNVKGGEKRGEVRKVKENEKANYNQKFINVKKRKMGDA